MFKNIVSQVLSADFPRDKFLHPSILRAKQVAWMLDNALTLPVVKKRIGLDPILGLIPGAGDAVAFALSLYILWVAYDLNLPRKVLVRMGVNVAVDQLISLVPLLGDVADAFWKSNVMNVQLLEEAWNRQERREQPVVDVEAEPLD